MKNKVNMSCVYDPQLDTLMYLTHDMTPKNLNGGLIWDSGTPLQNFPDGTNQEFFHERAYLLRGILSDHEIVELTGVVIEDGDIVALNDFSFHGKHPVSTELIEWLVDLKNLEAHPVSLSPLKARNRVLVGLTLNDQFTEEVKTSISGETANDEGQLNPYTQRHVTQQGVEETMHYLHGAITDKLFTYFDTSEKVQLEAAIEDLKDLMKLHDMNEVAEDNENE